MPRLPDAKVDIEVFKAAVRDYQDRVMKPFGSAVGKILRPQSEYIGPVCAGASVDDPLA